MKIIDVDKNRKHVALFIKIDNPNFVGQFSRRARELKSNYKAARGTLQSWLCRCYSILF
jgi:hypothetical protein